MGDYTIAAISESAIADVFPYFSGEEGDAEKLERFNNLKKCQFRKRSMERK